MEANLMRLTLGRLLPGCDETRPEDYLSVLEARGTATEMYKNPNWDAHLINKEMIEMLWKDCADTAERIDTNAFDRFPEEHKWGMRLLGESIMGFGYGCVLYYATIEDQSQPRRQNSEAEEKTTNDAVKTESNADSEVEATGEGDTESKLDDLLNSDYYKRDFGYDCSEIAEDFYDAAGQKGKIYRIEGKNGYINGYEYNYQVEYLYHEVYSDGVYIYDPRYVNTPVLKADYFRALREINPDGFDVFTIQ